jgi:hypothetical protein
MPIQTFRLMATTCLALSILHAQAAWTGDFLDEKGNHLGTDGLKNDSLYVIKTTQREFAGGGRAAGISSEEANKAKTCVFRWDGVADSFRRHPWIYFDFQSIEWRDSIREQMIAIVSKDDGPGEKEKNKREFGGTVAANYKVLENHPGDISTRGEEVRIFLTIRSNTIEEFHTHPSGGIHQSKDRSTGNIEKVLTNASAARPQQDSCFPCDYCQPPPPEDIRQIGIKPGPDSTANGERVVDRVGYVFGMCDRKVYVFTDKGITAVLPRERFVRYHTKRKF